MRCALVPIAALFALSALMPASAQEAALVPDLIRPEECVVAPRTIDELKALIPDAEAEAGDGADDWVASLPDDGYPDGEPAAPADAAAVAATIRQFNACVNAGDLLRLLALYSDANVRRLLADATPEQFDANPLPPPTPKPEEEWAGFLAVRHVREVADGRVVAVLATTSLAANAIVELYALIRQGDRWLVDGARSAPYVSGDFDGVVGDTYTDPQTGVGLSWDDTWVPWQHRGGEAMTTPPASQPVAAAMAEFVSGLSSALVVSNGTSVVVYSSRSGLDGDPEPTLEECAGAVITRYPSSTQALAVGADGQPMQGGEGDRRFAVYDESLYFADGAGDVAYRLTIECRDLPRGLGQIKVVHWVPTSEYEAQLPARDALLASLQSD